MSPSDENNENINNNNNNNNNDTNITKCFVIEFIRRHEDCIQKRQQQRPIFWACRFLAQIRTKRDNRRYLARKK
jgi:hypothetical protein